MVDKANKGFAGEDNFVPGVSLVITSCGREELLHKTCNSFARFNTYPLQQAILVEDGEIDHDPNLVAKLLNLPSQKVTIIKNQKNLGQIKSIDRAYAEVRSQYIFHCEDDWEFYREGFIEKSMYILKRDSKIFSVWLRAHNDTNGHPIDPLAYQSAEGVQYFLLSLNYRKLWGGFSFNPGLRRTKDYHEFGKYADAEIIHHFKGKTNVSESDLSMHYQRMGFRAAILDDPIGYVRHIGGAHHLAADWELPTIVMIKNWLKKIKEKISSSNVPRN
jgi:glycosyltransferase involved in cell wall biosynthesis